MRTDDHGRMSKQLKRQRIEPAREQAYFEELDQMKGTFVSRMSHEFRTPLTSILGFAELIVDDPEMSAQTCKKFARIILNEGERLSALINNLLDLSLIEKGGLPTRMNEENIVPAIENVIIALVPQARPKLLTITSDFQSRCIPVCIDKNHFREIVHQLLSNAIKFTPAGGHILDRCGNMRRPYRNMGT